MSQFATFVCLASLQSAATSVLVASETPNQPYFLVFYHRWGVVAAVALRTLSLSLHPSLNFEKKKHKFYLWKERVTAMSCAWVR